MNLPSEEVQRDYLKTQIEAVQRKRFLAEMSLDFDQERLKLAKGKEEKREIEDAIEENNLMIEGADEYLAVLTEMYGTEMSFPKADMTDILKKKVDEIEKANFRGVVAKKLQEARTPKDTTEERAVEDELTMIDKAIKANDLIHKLAVRKLDDIS